MRGPLNGVVRQVIAGKVLTLVCDINAMCRIEASLDRPISDVLRAYDADELRLSEERAILAAFLGRHHPEISEAQAGDIMSDDLNGSRVAVHAALSAAMPENDPGKKPLAAGIAISRLAAWISRAFFWPMPLRAVTRLRSGG